MPRVPCQLPLFFFFNDTATTEIYTLSLHDALPISTGCRRRRSRRPGARVRRRARADRKSTRLNSSHGSISYAVFCLKKKTRLRRLPASAATASIRLVLPHRDSRPLALRGPCHASEAPGPAPPRLSCFFFNDTATTEIYTLSLHDALPISSSSATLWVIVPVQLDRRPHARAP